MIVSFRHSGLEDLYYGRTTRRVSANHLQRLRRILGALDMSSGPQDMDIAGYRFHQLSGQLRGYYSVTVSGNWRVIFRFENEDAADVDYLDYH